MTSTGAAAPVALAADVLAFWTQAGPDRWFKKDDVFDAAIRDRFLATYAAAADGKLADWEATPEGALALVIVLYIIVCMVAKVSVFHGLFFG